MNQPLNIDLLLLDRSLLSTLMEVNTRDVFEQNSTTFHHSGLFSNTIFGEQGTEARQTTFAYIDLGLDILHPKVFKELTSLNSLYKKIFSGDAIVTYDKKEKDFSVQYTSKDITGTGYSFFLQYYNDIKFKETESIQRRFKILFIKKYKLQDVTINKLLVLPAGLRDYTITKSGKPMESEINNLYRKLITVATTAKQFKSDVKNKNNIFINSIKFRLQKVVNEIYDYIENMLDGKSKFIQGKWTKRAIQYGTRNVITALPQAIDDLNKEDNISALATRIGVFQFIKGTLPRTIYLLRSKFLNNKFDLETSKAKLIDSKTLKAKFIDISEKERSRWLTDDALEETLNRLSQESIMKSPIIIDKHYLMLVYDNKDEIILLNDIDELPNELDKSKVRPITYLELLYIANVEESKSDYGMVTRYPIVAYGNTFPTKVYLKTTTVGRRVKYKLSVIDNEHLAPEYPLLDKPVYVSLSVPEISLGALGADFDGDKVSFNIAWTEEGKADIKRKLNDKNFFIDPNGELAFSASTHVGSIFLDTFTSD